MAQGAGHGGHRRRGRDDDTAVLLLGGALGADPSAVFDAWAPALEQPSVRGLVVGRALLYPHDGDVAGAIDRAAVLVEAAAKRKAGA